jgi:hypothetical protein
MEQTYGQKLVRASFNPSASSAVDQIKSACADLITAFDEARATASPDAARCYSLAITHIETAAMFAVKGATTPA